MALACLPVFMSGREIARWEGGVFLGYYVAYVAYLILAPQQHDALPAFSGVMMGYVVPLTAVTLMVVVIAVRQPASPEPMNPQAGGGTGNLAPPEQGVLGLLASACLLAGRFAGARLSHLTRWQAVMGLGVLVLLVTLLRWTA